MKRIPAILFLAVLCTVPAIAQEGAVAVLEYASDFSEIGVYDRNNFEVEIFLGIGLSSGDRIVTGDSSVELRLEPNGSIIRLAPNTTFVIDSLQGEQGAPETASTLQRGRARFVAARSDQRRNVYSVRSPGAVLGVRGTDFGIAVISDGAPVEEDPVDEEVFVFSGEVIVTARATGEDVFLAAGQGIALSDEPFLPQEWGADRISAFEEPLRFEQLGPGAVPRPTAEEPAARDVIDEPALPPAPPPAPTEPPAPEPGAMDRFFGGLAEITGLQVGSVTINQVTYGQVVFQPRIRTGDFELAFYLPITYSSNLFDPDDWYHPGGNNEWSFGTDFDWTDDPRGALTDLATDVALKIRYLQYRDRGAPFFIKLGNLSSFTVGQGLLMRNYANDLDFPAVRRLGLNTGVDREAWGFEAFVNDLIDPSIYGGRLYFRPAAPVIPAAVGFSSIVDISPATAISSAMAADPGLAAATREADPVFINVAADLDVPFVRTGLLSLIAFIEGGASIPYVRNNTTVPDDGDGREVSSGTKTNAMVDFQSGNLRNFGWTTGIRGDLLFFDYRLAYQYHDGTFRPGFYGPSYDRVRGIYAMEAIEYLSDTEADRFKSQNMGIHGELGATLFDALHIGAGYLWPWEITTSGSWVPTPEDELVVRFTLQEGVVPLGFGAGLEYRRRFLAASLGNWGGYSSSDLFDVNTTVDGYVSYPLTDFISVVARVSTTTQTDAEGNIVYDSAGLPKMTPTVVIQTEIGF